MCIMCVREHEEESTSSFKHTQLVNILLFRNQILKVIVKLYMLR